MGSEPPGDGPRLTTERLELLPLSEGDAAELRALFNREEVRRFLWDGRTLSNAQVTGLLARNEALFENEGVGLWGIRVLGGGPDLKGFAGLWYFHDPPELELLYGLVGEVWGLGLATEAATAVAWYAIERRGHTRIVASADAPNVASHRVMERLGMTFVRRALDEGLDTVWYARDVAGAPPEWPPPAVSIGESAS